MQKMSISITPVRCERNEQILSKVAPVTHDPQPLQTVVTSPKSETHVVPVRQLKLEIKSAPVTTILLNINPKKSTQSESTQKLL